MDKLNGLLNFLDLVEAAELSYTLKRVGDSVCVSIAMGDGDLLVNFTGDGEILVCRQDDGVLLGGVECLEGLFHTVAQ